jgi:hypothetical protein
MRPAQPAMPTRIAPLSWRLGFCGALAAGAGALAGAGVTFVAGTGAAFAAGTGTAFAAGTAAAFAAGTGTGLAAGATGLAGDDLANLSLFANGFTLAGGAFAGALLAPDDAAALVAALVIGRFA